MSTANNNNTSLNESIETNCDISLPLLSNNQETKANARIVSNNDKKRASDMQNLQKHEYFLPPLLYSYGPNEYDSDIKLEKTASKDTVRNSSSVEKHPEISALSVLSLLENNDEVEREMDTTRDLQEEPEPRRPKIHIENLSSTLKGSEEITPPPSTQHCDCKNYARTANGELIKCPKPKIFFNDNIRSVDFVLVWDAHSEDATTAEAFCKRRIFEENLMKDGLNIEYEDPEQNGLNFVKLPALPEIRSHTNFLTKGVKYIGSRWSKLKSFILVDTNIFPKKNQRFTAVYSRDREYFEDICNSNNVTMCPLCDHWCDYWDLKETCMHSRITYLFDNPTTVFFAIFMSFWGERSEIFYNTALFLEMWKRYSAEITHRWDLTGFDIKEEHPRPQYLARLAHVKRRRLNVVTNTEEPRVPFWRIKVPATILSFSVVLLLITLALATVLGVVLYRMSVSAALKVYNGVTTSSAIFFTSATAACINLCCIVVFNWIYSLIAQYLTEIELHRTQTEFDDALTLKIYLLQFINYYASIFYIAFFKGKFIGSPKKYNRFFGYRQEEGFIIAFTSNFIPRLVYAVAFSKDHTLDGYLNHSLAYFNTTDFQVASYPNNSVQYEICRYPDYREPPWVSRDYERTSTFWHILAARLAFVVVFENVVAFVMIMVKWCIPDIPRELSDKIRREAYITNEIIIKQETLRAQSAPKTETGRLSALERMGAGDMPSTPEQWDRLIAKSLSGSEFDFMVHNNSFPSGSPTTKVMGC
ncbi:ngep-related [Holotrichia oblita]|uniref:Ngep-related n=1 Tax=Holotrichia oblita TaxID=644536 RepID=A0ACB9TFZ5_HOLOL|nr:ngep-related [Holotrichia oblita]